MIRRHQPLRSCSAIAHGAGIHAADHPVGTGRIERSAATIGIALFFRHARTAWLARVLKPTPVTTTAAAKAEAAPNKPTN